MGNDVGKVVGVVAGAALGPVGMVAGGVIGAAIDNDRRPNPSPPQHITVVDEKQVAKDAAIQKLSGFDRSKKNIAITGQRGKGKSTTTNALIRKRDNDPGAAAVNETEQTMKPTQYLPPHRGNYAFWDLPGAGTAAHPITTYFSDKGLLAFDCVIIVCDDAFTENDLYIAKAARDAGIKVIAVRNKANNSLAARLRRSGGSNNVSIVKSQLINEIRSDIVRNLTQSNLSSIPVYVINSWAIMDSNEVKFEEEEFEHALYN